MGGDNMPSIDLYNEVQEFEVYDRKGKPCHRCRTRVQRIVLGGRGTYFCPNCQR
jgi:formamidopyrimidine-DNA glycosylase